MLKRLFVSLAALGALLAAAPSLAAEPVQKIELTSIMGRWYEVARLPNQLQRGCTSGASARVRSR